MDIVHGLAEFPGRGAGTDAERRAAGWLATELGHGQEAVVETFWCRPNWALAHALHAALGVAGGLIALVSPVVGVAILALALASVLADWLTGRSLARSLTREHASQNVLAKPSRSEATDHRRVHLILTANYDAGRTGLVYRDWLRRPAGAVRRALGAFTLGWLGWLAIAIVWLLAVAALRLAGHNSHAIGVLQLLPTAALLIGSGLLLDVAVASWSPAAGDNATGVGVAVALSRSLGATPPQHLDVELVLAGAGDGDQIGLRRYLRTRRRDRAPAITVVLGIAPCMSGAPRWWCSDGQFIALRYARQLRQLAQEIAADEPHLHAKPYKGRGATPALAARHTGLPAITIGCLDDSGLAPRSHQRTDAPDAVDSSALDDALQFALLMVDAIDSAVGELQTERTVTPA